MADFNEYKGVWVFCEQRQGALMSTDFELVSEARKLADELGCEVTGLLLGDNVEGIAKELGGYGADKVMVCDSPLLKDYTTDGYAKALCDLIMDKTPEIMLLIRRLQELNHPDANLILVTLFTGMRQSEVIGLS